MNHRIPIFVTAIAAVIAGWVLIIWMSRAVYPLKLREASVKGALAESLVATAQETDLTGCFKIHSEVVAGSTQGSWSGFRGPYRDNIAREAGKLASAWPTNGPSVLWSIKLGDGHAMPALANGCLYLLDYDEARGGDCLRCLNADTGQAMWEHIYAVKTKRNHGISRTVATTDGESVITIGPQCHVLCLDARSGAYRWGFNLTQRYGTKVPLWYTGQCPLLDKGIAIIAPAGTNTVLFGIDLKRGAVVFETPNLGGLAMSHSSVMTLQVAGERHYIYAALGGIIGVAADGAKRGQLLWRTNAFTPSVIAPSPVPLSDGRFYMTAGYGSGGAMFQVSCAEEKWRVELLFKTDRKLFASEQQTPVFLDGLLYTVLPSDGGGNRRELACMTPEGQRLWTSGKENSFGLGPYVATDKGVMYLLNDEGTLTMARVGREGFKVLGRHALMKEQGRDAWGPMVLVNGRLYLRDSTQLYCLQVGEP